MRTYKTSLWVEKSQVSEIISQVRHQGGVAYVLTGWMQDSTTKGMTEPVYLCLEGYTVVNGKVYQVVSSGKKRTHLRRIGEKKGFYVTQKNS